MVNAKDSAVKKSAIIGMINAPEKPKVKSGFMIANSEVAAKPFMS